MVHKSRFRKNSIPHLSVVKGLEETISLIFREGAYDLNKRFIAIHPGSSNPVKIWDIAKYAELINKAKRELDIDFVLLGTEAERDLTSSIIELIEGDILDLTGKLDLFQLAFVLGKSSIFIGNDNGPMHMAAAVNVPVVAIFKKTQPGTNPARWRPYTEKAVVFHENPEPDTFIKDGLYCDYRRRDEVTPEDVLAAVREKLEWDKSE